MKPILCTILLLFSLTLFSQKQNLKTANEKFQKRDFKGAIQDCDKMISINKNPEDAYILRGDCKDSLIDATGAIEDYSKAIEINRKSESGYYKRGCMKMRYLKITEALQDFEVVIKLNPRNALAYSQRGRTKEFLYDFKQLADLMPAIDDNLIAYRLDSNNFEIIYNIAYVYFNANNYKEAVRYYSRAIKLYPKEDMAYYSRGLTTLRMGDTTQAINDFSSAILVPGNSYYSAYLERGKIYSGRNDFQKSLADFTKAISIDSSMLDAYYCRGYAYYYSNYFQSAANDYSRVINSKRGDVDYFKPTSLYMRGFCYSNLTQFGEACRDWQETFILGYQGAEVARLIKENCKDYDRPIKKPQNVLSIDGFSKCFNSKANFLQAADTFLTKNIYYRTDSLLNGRNYNNTVFESATYISTEDNGKDRQVFMQFKPSSDSNYEILLKEIREKSQILKKNLEWGVFHFDIYSYKDKLWFGLDDSLKAIRLMNKSKYVEVLKDSKQQSLVKEIKPKKNETAIIARFPDPVTYFGVHCGTDSITKQELTSIKEVLTKTKDDEFNKKYPFTLISFEFTLVVTDKAEFFTSCEGSKIESKILDMFKIIPRGAKIYIDNVKAKGPDGSVRNLPGVTLIVK